MINSSSLLYMNKHDNYLCMDLKTYFRFIKHIHMYFKERLDIPEGIYSKLTCAKISIHDLTAICFFWAGYYCKEDVLALTEYFPEKPVFPRELSFTLNLYTEDDIIVPIIMDSIPDSKKCETTEQNRNSLKYSM